MEDKSICRALGLASATLLGLEPVQAEIFSGWETDSSILYYAETDRVKVIEPVATLRKEIDSNEYINIQLAYDTISGATPNGATPTQGPQLFTSPSCESAYLTPANEKPLRKFSDQRAAISGTWELPIKLDVRNQFGAHFSAETDYTSFGLNNTVLMDFNKRNTTLAFSFGIDGDHVDPAGGKPEGLTSLLACNAANNAGEDEGEEEEFELEEIGKVFSEYNSDKSVSSALVGVTQVLSRNALIQLNYSLNQARGYLTDPYKILSVVDSSSGDTVDYVFEQRPSVHRWQSLYSKLVYGFKQDVVHLSYRYYWDDWDIRSHTLELAYRYAINESVYLRPWVRHYQQSAAEFYRHSLLNNESLSNASADQRLAEFTGTTLGVRIAYHWQAQDGIYLRLSRLKQRGDSHPNDAIGSQQNQDLFADLDANMVQLGLQINLD